MIKKIIFITISLSLFFAIASYAEQNTIRLICKYTHTVDGDGKLSPTSGEDLITVHYSDNGKATIIKQGLGAEFNGTVSDEEIHGQTAYQLSNLKFQETLFINRYTGGFEIIIKIIGSKSGLVHYGTCQPVTKKKF